MAAQDISPLSANGLSHTTVPDPGTDILTSRSHGAGKTFTLGKRQATPRFGLVVLRVPHNPMRSAEETLDLRMEESHIL